MGLREAIRAGICSIIASGTPTPLRKISGILPFDRIILPRLIAEGPKCITVSRPLILWKSIPSKTDCDSEALDKSASLKSVPMKLTSLRDVLERFRPHHSGFAKIGSTKNSAAEVRINKGSMVKVCVM